MNAIDQVYASLLTADGPEPLDQIVWHARTGTTLKSRAIREALEVICDRGHARAEPKGYRITQEGIRPANEAMWRLSQEDRDILSPEPMPESMPETMNRALQQGKL